MLVKAFFRSFLADSSHPQTVLLFYGYVRYSFISLFVRHVSALPKDTSTNKLSGLSPQ